MNEMFLITFQARDQNDAFLFVERKVLTLGSLALRSPAL